jgi:CRP-like cAMP-binding protein
MGRHETTEARLSALPLIGTATPRDLRALAAAGDLVVVDGGHVLHTAGEHPRACHLVVDGVVEVVVDGRTVAVHGPGELVGLVEAVDGQPAAGDAVVAGPATVLALTAPRLRGLLERNHVVRVAAFRQLAVRTRALDDQLAS